MSLSTSSQLCGLLLVAFVGVMVAARVPLLDDGLEDFQVRDADNLQQKPEIRDNGLGALLLKNLRFRDLSARDLASILDSVRPENDVPKVRGLVEKRNDMSVSQIAALVHALKSRDLDDQGVKLQSLRFGK